MVDPSDAGEVARALLDALRDELAADDLALAGPLRSPGQGMSTFLWFFALAGDGVPPAWRQPLALRLYGRVGEREVAEREAAVQSFVAGHGFPAPRALAWRDEHNALGLPWVVMPEIQGSTLLDHAVRRPHRMPATLRRLAELQHRLHRVPLDDCPLVVPAAGRPLVDRSLDELDGMLARHPHPDAEPGLDWLRAHAATVRREQPVLVHRDFHPLNVLVPADGGEWQVIDWTDATVGDLHADVGCTLAVLWAAALGVDGRAARLALRAARGSLARWYRAGYEACRPLEPARVAYWEALRVYRGWLQVLELGADDDRPTTRAAAAVPASLAEGLARRFDELRARS